MYYLKNVCKCIVSICTDDIGRSASWLTDCMMDAAESVVNGEDSSQEGNDAQVCTLSILPL